MMDTEKVHLLMFYINNGGNEGMVSSVIVSTNKEDRSKDLFVMGKIPVEPKDSFEFEFIKNSELKGLFDSCDLCLIVDITGIEGILWKVREMPGSHYRDILGLVYAKTAKYALEYIRINKDKLFKAGIFFPDEDMEKDVVAGKVINIGRSEVNIEEIPGKSDTTLFYRDISIN